MYAGVFEDFKFTKRFCNILNSEVMIFKTKSGIWKITDYLSVEPYKYTVKVK